MGQQSSSEPDLEQLAATLRKRLISQVRHGVVDRIDGPDEVHSRVVDLVEREAGVLQPETRRRLAARIVQSAVGLGPLEVLLSDPAVDEVMVNGTQPVWVERRGELAVTDVRFADRAELEDMIERILAPLGRRVDSASPICDARLPDGSRVNVIIAPLALDGPIVTIRRFRHHELDAQQLVELGTLTNRALAFLAACVRARVSLLVSGGTGSGKTTTLNALSAYIPECERIITIEDAAELRLRQRHVVRLESRPANVEARGEITIRALVRNSLRMRPDRIIVGEVRGGEALDMLAAMTTGHDGSLATVHANSARDALARIESLALMGGVELPHSAVRSQTASAIDLVVHHERIAGGARRVAEISEVSADCEGGYQVHRVWWRDSNLGDQWAQPHCERLRAAWAEAVENL